MVDRFFLPYHFPRFLISDCGSEFLNKIQRSVCNLLKIEQITSALYHHQTIGALENSHKALNHYLCSFAEEDKYNWDLWLPYFSYAYNSTVDLATNYAPFELVFGKNNDISFGTVKKFDEPIYDYDEFANELKYRLKVSLKDAKDCQNIKKHRRKLEYDKYYRVKEVDYQVGDFVLLRNNSTNNKLEDIFKGPYEIKKLNNKNVFLEIKNKDYKASIDDIKPFYSILEYWIDINSI